MRRYSVNVIEPVISGFRNTIVQGVNWIKATEMWRVGMQVDHLVNSFPRFSKFLFFFVFSGPIQN